MRFPALFFLLALAMALTQLVDAPLARAVVPGTTFTVNSTGNADDSNTGDDLCDSDPAPGDQCTLRAAIKQASADPDQDVIQFNIDALDVSNNCTTDACFIAPNPALPTVNQPAIIDATTQPGYAGKPLIVIDAVLAGGAPALRITGGNTTVRGLDIVRACCVLGVSHGIELSQNGDNAIEGNFIGIDWTGTIVDPTPLAPNSGDELGNVGSGIYVNGVSNNTIGGATLDKRNVISGNRYEGIWISGGSNNTLAGNFIGVDLDGVQDLGNQENGVLVQDSPNNTIGGTTGITPGSACSGACNLVSGNNDDGVEVSGAPSSGNLIAGNFIGSKASGAGRIRNNLYGVFINGAPNNTVGGTEPAARNLISGNTSADVRIQATGATGNVVSGNFIGTTLTGGAKIDPFQVAGKGVIISGAPNNTIGGNSGTTPDTGCAGPCNVISGHSGDGVEISGGAATGNTVQGNYIGVDVLGTYAIGNGNPTCTDGSGVLVSGAPGNVIGGNEATERNLISGNSLAGIEFVQATSDNNIVHGNYIGTDKAGSTGIGNCKYGVYINGAENEQIGGVNLGEGNLISGNAPAFVAGTGGILINGTAAKTNVIRGNLIGTDATGQLALGNGGAGIFVNSAPNNTIGGTNPGERNVISGNGVRGVEVAGTAASGNKVLGNHIGLDIDGQQAIPNGGNGVLLFDAPNNTIGGLAAGARNLISGNAAVGIDIVDPNATGNVIQGNFIGTGAAGNSDVGNGSHGIRISDAPGNFVGGTLPDARNVISGNDESGVYIEGNSAKNNQVRGNFIGVALDGTSPIGNADNGVHVAGSANLNTIGGSLSGAGNVIASNSEDGIFVDQTAGTGNAASQNEIRDNGQLGIDLGTATDVAPGVTPNDPGDADVNGGNELQNFPVVTLAESDNDATPGTHITGTLNSKANASFTVDLYGSPTCDPSGYGEGEDHLGAVNVSTDGSGNASFNAIYAFHIASGWQVTATATDSIGNTSEFSLCEAVVFGTVTPPPGVTPTPAPTPPPGTLLQGDVNCQGGVNAVDALALLRYVAGLSVSQAPGCPAIGANLPPVWGNVNCDGSVNSVDALALLRHTAGLSVNQRPGCTPIGQPLS